MADPVFKRIFGTEKEILIEFINLFIELEHPVVAIEFLPQELISENSDEKIPVVDVRCIDTANRQFIMEIQLSTQEYFIKRSQFYLSRVYGRQLARGESYSSLEPVYMISLLNFILFNELPDWYQSFSMRSEQNYDLKFDGFHLIYIELPKLRKIANFNSDSLRDQWMLFLTDPEKMLTMLKRPLSEYPNLKKAVELLDESQYTPSQLAAYDSYLDKIMTWNAVMITNYDNGWKEGMEKGVEKGMEKGAEIGKNEARSHFSNIIAELKKGILTPEEIALKFQEPIEFILSLKGL